MLHVVSSHLVPLTVTYNDYRYTVACIPIIGYTLLHIIAIIGRIIHLLSTYHHSLFCLQYNVSDTEQGEQLGLYM